MENFPLKTIYKYEPYLFILFLNVLPLLGVLFLGWDPSGIILLFWIENIIIGFFNILKMLVKGQDIFSWIGKLFLIPFFMVHYFAFMFGHFIFLNFLFGFQSDGIIESLMNQTGNEQTILDLIYYHCSRLGMPFLEAHIWYFISVLNVFLFHAYLFGYNFIIKKEYRNIDLPGLMVQPYGKIVIQHLVIIAGGILLQFFHQKYWIVMVLIFLKSIYDVRAYRKELNSREAIKTAMQAGC